MCSCSNCFYSRDDRNGMYLVCCCLESPFLFMKVENNGICCKWDSEKNLKERAKNRNMHNDMEGEELKYEKDPLEENKARYNARSNECIEEMIEVFGISAVIDFCKCNVWKYRYRNRCEKDLIKADWYMDKVIELKEREKQERLKL